MCRDVRSFFVEAMEQELSQVRIVFIVYTPVLLWCSDPIQFDSTQLPFALSFEYQFTLNSHGSYLHLFLSSFSFFLFNLFPLPLMSVYLIPFNCV